MRYRVLWPLLGPGAFPTTCKTASVRQLYANDEFDDIGTPAELARLVAEGMIQPVETDSAATAAV